jgi:hypothetical protein
MCEDLDPIAQLKFGAEIESISAQSKPSSREIQVVRRWKAAARGASIILLFEIQQSTLINP